MREREGEREDGGWRGKDGGKDRKKINAMLILYKFVVAPPPPCNAQSSFKVKQVASRNIFYSLYTKNRAGKIR